MGIKTLDEYEKVERVGRFDTRIIRENRKYFSKYMKHIFKQEGGRLFIRLGRYSTNGMRRIGQ